MDRYNNDDRIIDLKGLVIKYLKKWRVILAVMGLCAVLLGVYGAVRAPGPAVLTAEEKSAIQQQLDANSAELNACRETLRNSQAQLLSASDIVIKRQADIAAVEDRLADQLDYLSVYENMLEDARRILGSVPAGDRAELMAQITSLTEKIPAMQDTAAATEAQLTAMRQELAALEDSFETTLPKSAEEAAARIEQLEKKDGELRASLSPVPGKVTAGGVLKMALIGAAAGAFAVACFVLWKELAGKNIDGADFIRQRYHIPVLADLHVSQGRPSARFDLALERMNGEIRQLDEKSTFPILAAKLRSFFPDESGEILLCGTADIKAVEQLRVRLQKYMTGDITLRAAGNPAADAEAALAVKKASVVLVEETGRSMYPETDEVMEQLTLSRAGLLGCILI